MVTKRTLAAGVIVLAVAGFHTETYDTKWRSVVVRVPQATSDRGEEHAAVVRNGFARPVGASKAHPAVADWLLSGSRGRVRRARALSARDAPLLRVCSPVVPNCFGVRVAVLGAGYLADRLERVSQAYESPGTDEAGDSGIQPSPLEAPREGAQSATPPFVIASIVALAMWFGLLALCAYLVTVTGDPRVLRYLAEVVAAARRRPPGVPSARPPRDQDSGPGA